MQQKLESTLAKLVAFPSWSDNHQACRQITEFVRSELEPLGLHITADTKAQHPWVVATTQHTTKPKILLVAHLDVVPAVDDSQYELRIDSGRLYGRGVWDMKYAVAAYIELLKSKENVLHEYDFGVMFTTDEEIGGYQGVRKLLKDGWRTELAFIPDYGDNWQIEESAKGLYTVRLSVPGKSAHSSRPWEGENAIQKLIPLLHELQTIYPSVDKYGPTLSINVIEGGEVMNKIADSALAVLDFRSFSNQEIADYQMLLNRLAAEQDATFEEISAGPPLELDKSAPLVKQYVKVLAERGISPTFEKSFGGTDGRWFAEHGIPCIITGPHGENAHGPTEWIRREDLVEFYNLLEHFIETSTRVSVLDEAPQMVYIF